MSTVCLVGLQQPDNFCVFYPATGNIYLTRQSPQQSVCPGDVVVYLCTVPGNAVIWGTPLIGEFVVLEAFVTPPMGGYVARLVQYDGVCLTSNLTFSASQTTITCENSARSLQNSTTIDVEGMMH